MHKKLEMYDCSYLTEPSWQIMENPVDLMYVVWSNVYDEMIPLMSLQSVATSFTQKLTAPPAEPHVSGRVIQASVWIPKSIH